ncbi:MAG: hypothetical protein K8L97_27220 [Anaerolineae bacterium]|nr:hypothetical protein [Anaerolineae bacterium]
MTLADFAPSLISILFPEPEPDTIEVGDIVETWNGSIGRVKTISLSPYYEEEVQGIFRAYIIPLGEPPQGEGWADWCLAEEVKLVEKGFQAAA